MKKKQSEFLKKNKVEILPSGQQLNDDIRYILAKEVQRFKNRVNDSFPLNDVEARQLKLYADMSVSIAKDEREARKEETNNQLTEEQLIQLTQALLQLPEVKK